MKFVNQTSKYFLSLLEKPRCARFFVVVSLEGCIPCSNLLDDLAEGAVDHLGVVLHIVKTNMSNEDDLTLLNFLKSGEFPLLALIENGKVERRWAGYFDLEPPKRGLALRELIATAWGVKP